MGPYNVSSMNDRVSVVHVVAKTHFDLGFTDLAAEVTHRYVTEFFPGAVQTAAELRARAGPERLVWTTGSWILHHALGEGSAAERRAVAAGVEAGDLAWHALPVTTHTELMDAELVRSGLGISAELDARFGRHTVAAKMTDVPGHTRGLVPLLAEAKVSFLHLGVNPAWPVPDVPSVFRWRSPDGAEVVVAYQAGGYGGEVAVPDCPEVLAFLHSGDNLGPPSADEVVAAHAALSARYPEAQVVGSTLDGFARALSASGAVADLPVVTAEIGDPWLFGAGSDPAKVARFRDLLRRRRALPASSAERRAVDRTLLLVAEHTWGLDQKVALPDTEQWSRPALAALRRTPRAQRFEASWAEQRAYLDDAERLLAATPPERDPVPGGPWPFSADGLPLGGFRSLVPGEMVTGAGWEVGVDATGAVAHLLDHRTGRQLAGPDHPLGRLAYQSFDAADYERFYSGLIPLAEDEDWARQDNTKPGIEAAGAVSGWWDAELSGAWHAVQADGEWHSLLARLRFGSLASQRLGAPPESWVRWCWHRGSTEIDLDLWWADKPANRLPEALWCSFVPNVAEPERWTLDKLGEAVSPLDVVRRGGRALHAVGEGMSYRGADGTLEIRTTDAPLVAPGQPRLLDADPPLPDLAGGFHVLLHDNCWGTNFPMWAEGPARYRFTVEA